MIKFGLRCISLSFVFVLIWVSHAVSHMPDFDLVQEQVLANYKSLERWHVEMKMDSSPVILVDGWRNTTFWRQEWRRQDDSNRPLLFLASIGRKNKLIASYPSRDAVPLPLLDYWIPDSSVWLERLGVKTTVMSYQFFDNRPCLVIGAQYGDFSSPQFWVDNERKIPLRLRYKTFDFQWLSYRKIGNFWLPLLCRIIIENEKAYTFSLSWKNVNGSVAPEMFSPNAFKQEFYGMRVAHIPSEVRPVFSVFPHATGE